MALSAAAFQRPASGPIGPGGLINFVPTQAPLPEQAAAPGAIPTLGAPPDVPVLAPGDLASQRGIAEMLMAKSQQPVTDVMGGFAGMAEALAGGDLARKAGKRETAALEGNQAADDYAAKQMSSIMSAYLMGQEPDPAALETAMSNPRNAQFIPQIIAARAANAKEKTTPYSDMGKIQSDLDAGLITDQQAEQAFNELSATGGVKFNDQGGLRKEIQATPAYQKMAEALPIYKSMLKSAHNNTRAADLDLVYGMAKILDPIGAVRGEDSIMVSNTASIPDWLQGEINRLNGGQGLLPATRNAILQQAGIRVGEMKAAWDETVPQYENIVKAYGLDPAQIIPNFGEIPSFTPLTDDNGGGPRQTTITGTETLDPEMPAPDDPVAAELARRGYVFKGGTWVKP